MCSESCVGRVRNYYELQARICKGRQTQLGIPRSGSNRPQNSDSGHPKLAMIGQVGRVTQMRNIVSCTSVTIVCFFIWLKLKHVSLI